MFILSFEECSIWAKQHGVFLDHTGWPVPCNKTSHRLRGRFPLQAGKLLTLASQIQDALNFKSQILFWITQTGIFSSSENLQLVYRYRQSYGSSKSLSDTPGHLCHSYERAEIITLLWLSMLQGWDAHIFSDMQDTPVFISHDEYFEIGYVDMDACKEGYGNFAELGLNVSCNQA